MTEDYDMTIAERAWNPVCGLGGVDRSGLTVLVPRQLDVPLRRRKPTTWFVDSMADLFHESLTNEEIAAVFGVMTACPQHTFQVLTTRAKRMRAWFEWLPSDGLRWTCMTEAIRQINPYRPALERRVIDSLDAQVLQWPLPNVWLGASCEDQQRADERIPLLLDTPAAVRFVSCEPLLGPVDFGRVPLDPSDPSIMRGIFNPLEGGGTETATPWRINWVIVGGESGPGARPARPCDVAWIRSIVRECRESDTPVFVKQLGSVPIVDLEFTDNRLHLRDPRGADPSEWPEDLRVRETP